jgi:hypothetical protein
MGSDNLRLMAEKAVFWVPTEVTMQAYCRYLRRIGEDADIARKNLDHQVEQLFRARLLKVPVAWAPMPATFVVVEGSPAGLPDSLRRIRGVYLRGESIE